MPVAVSIAVRHGRTCINVPEHLGGMNQGHTRREGCTHLDRLHHLGFRDAEIEAGAAEGVDPVRTFKGVRDGKADQVFLAYGQRTLSHRLSVIVEEQLGDRRVRADDLTEALEVGSLVIAPRRAV